MKSTENNRASAEAALCDQIKRRIAYHANEHRHAYEVGSGADGLASFSVLRGRPGTTAWASMQFTEHDIGRTVFLDPGDAAEALDALKSGDVGE
jgi:hypothetical protein